MICPYCDENRKPRREDETSPAGWCVFVVLLVVFFPVCWLGLKMKRDKLTCRACGCRIN